MGTAAAMLQKKGRKTPASRLSPMKISQKIFFSNAHPKKYCTAALAKRALRTQTTG